MFTNEEAIELILEEKMLTNPLNLSPLQTKWKIELDSNVNNNNKFFLDIQISSDGANIILSVDNKVLKTSHNHRISTIPLLRLDYGGRHQNPQNANRHVPSWIAQFAGKYFYRNEPHVHIYVESYGIHKLKWAVPLEYFEIEGKKFSLDSLSTFGEFLLATQEFADIINIINFSEYIKRRETLF